MKEPRDFQHQTNLVMIKFMIHDSWLNSFSDLVYFFKPIHLHPSFFAENSMGYLNRWSKIDFWQHKANMIEESVLLKGSNVNQRDDIPIKCPKDKWCPNMLLRSRCNYDCISLVRLTFGDVSAPSDDGEYCNEDCVSPGAQDDKTSLNGKNDFGMWI